MEEGTLTLAGVFLKTEKMNDNNGVGSCIQTVNLT